MIVSRFAAVTALSLTTLSPFPLLAGGDHDHGGGAEAAAEAPPMPRFEATNESFEIVGRVKGEDLTIFVDEWATNAPATNATIALTIGARKVPLKAAGDGIFTANLPEADKPATYPITISITRGGTTSLLAASLEVEEAHKEAPLVAGLGLAPVLGGGALVFVLIGGGLFLARRRRAAVAMGGLAIVLAASGLGLEPKPALAHGGDEEAAAPAGGSGDQASRLSNGDISAPKPMQRLIGMRTMLGEATNATAAVTLNGTVIADPNGMGVVQAQTGGRISGQLPALGQSVGQGQALARVTPAFDAAGRASLVESQGQVAQDLALAQQRAARLAGGGATEVDAELAAARSRANGGATAEARAELGAARQRLERLQRLDGVVPAREIEAARAQVRGVEARIAAQQAEATATVRALDARRATLVAEARGEASALGARAGALRATGNPNETLRAPISGTISAVNVAQGQVVAPGETLFSIIRPGSLLVEAKATDAASAQLSEMASGRTADGRTISLVRQGTGLSLVNGAIPIRYRVELDAGLRAGEPITVFASSAVPIQGIAVPRIAVARGSNGQSVVFIKESAEVIAPIPIVVVDLDADRVLVTKGLTAGQRIVVAGAPLLAQVR